MGQLNRSLTLNKSRNKTIDEYVERGRIKEFLCNPTLLVPLILERVGKKFGVSKSTKFQLNKVSGGVTYSNGSVEQKDLLIFYSYGQYLMNFESTTNFLLKKGIIQESKEGFVLTHQGLEWLHTQVTDLKNEKAFDEVVTDVDRLLITKIPIIIKDLLDRSDHFKPVIRTISGKNFLTVFDWSYYGKGIIQPYHYTLLYAYSRIEDYYIRLNSDDKSIFTDFNKIEDNINSDLLVKQRKKLRKNLTLPLTRIFEKSRPPYLIQEKIESKNYIHNLWYIVEAVNVFHAIPQINPSIGDIMKICLTDYMGALEDPNKTRTELKKMRESMIRNEVNKLWEEGILARTKIMNKHRYILKSLSFHDVMVDRDYRVLDHDVLRRLYNKKIKIHRS